mmetsp:Transcript_133600/g.285698  ORF Transcript_133600/g.285698 Transcript_133600/m.285698 type:complete len:206 (-) Transcript_133600:928-1545(-)
MFLQCVVDTHLQHARLLLRSSVLRGGRPTPGDLQGACRLKASDKDITIGVQITVPLRAHEVGLARCAEGLPDSAFERGPLLVRQALGVLVAAGPLLARSDTIVGPIWDCLRRDLVLVVVIERLQSEGDGVVGVEDVIDTQLSRQHELPRLLLDVRFVACRVRDGGEGCERAAPEEEIVDLELQDRRLRCLVGVAAEHIIGDDGAQ